MQNSNVGFTLRLGGVRERTRTLGTEAKGAKGSLLRLPEPKRAGPKTKRAIGRAEVAARRPVYRHGRAMWEGEASHRSHSGGSEKGDPSIKSPKHRSLLSHVKVTQTETVFRIPLFGSPFGGR